jgi:glycosyltransferase involved in cell wall biosynthesis
MNEPLISVITPFRNTARYLAACIESVLSQKYSGFEYLLSDNGSTDGSLEIAESYACRDSRIRIIRQSEPLSQPQHYNQVLTEISDASRYCKIVQADDLIFPECLQSMLGVFEGSGTIGLVSSYYLKGDTLRGSGYPFPAPWLPGKEMARLYLRKGIFVFGSPTTVMYRSSLVRECQPFYREDLLHEDTEKCMEILHKWDFGFVHQVLSFLRTDNVNESISAPIRKFEPDSLDFHIIVQRFSDDFLDPNEADVLKKDVKQAYYRILADQWLRIRRPAFWRYHKAGLATIGERIDTWYLAREICKKLLRMATDPGSTFLRALDLFRRARFEVRSRWKTGSPTGPRRR